MRSFFAVLCTFFSIAACNTLSDIGYDEADGDAQSDASLDAPLRDVPADADLEDTGLANNVPGDVANNGDSSPSDVRPEDADSPPCDSCCVGSFLDLQQLIDPSGAIRVERAAAARSGTIVAIAAQVRRAADSVHVVVRYLSGGRLLPVVHEIADVSSPDIEIVDGSVHVVVSNNDGEIVWYHRRFTGEADDSASWNKSIVGEFGDEDPRPQLATNGSAVVMSWHGIDAESSQVGCATAFRAQPSINLQRHCTQNVANPVTFRFPSVAIAPESSSYVLAAYEEIANTTTAKTIWWFGEEVRVFQIGTPVAPATYGVDEGFLTAFPANAERDTITVMLSATTDEAQELDGAEANYEAELPPARNVQLIRMDDSTIGVVWVEGPLDGPRVVRTAPVWGVGGTVQGLVSDLIESDGLIPDPLDASSHGPGLLSLTKIDAGNPRTLITQFVNREPRCPLGDEQ